jgi:hypothetical protein
VHPVRAIREAGRLPDLIDVAEQAEVDQVAVAGLFSLLSPRVVGRLGDVENP